MDLLKTMEISAAGMRAQSTRMRVISENIANSKTTAQEPGEDPYQRKLVTFRNVLDRATGTRLVEVGRVYLDKSEFGREHDPHHPAADASGYVLTPNVNTLIEMMDMRESQRTYEANLGVIRAARSMLTRMVELLRI